MLKLDRLVYRITLALSLFLFTAPLSPAQTAAASARVGASTLFSQPAFAALDSHAKSLYLQGVIADWQTSGDGRDFAFVQAAVDTVLTPAGDLRLSPVQTLPFGTAILLLYRVSEDPVFYHASKQLRDYLQPQQEKGDSDVAPFLADFGVTFGDASAAEQAADILLRVDTSDRDLETGLLRGSGSALDLARNTFYALDLINTIDRLPIGFHHRRGLTEALNKTVSALIARRDTHAVWQSSGQTAQTLLLNAYIVARAVRLGELAGSDATLAQRMAEVAHSVALTSADNGALLLAQSEADQVKTQAVGQGKTVVLDSWFTAEPHKNPAGTPDAISAKWQDETSKGLSFFGHAFQRYGMQLDALRVAPTSSSLSSAQIYVVAAPVDAFSHDVTKQDADAVETWVRDGGVLLLIGSQGDGEQASGLNTLAERFGMHVNAAAGSKSQGQADERGVLVTPPGADIFPISRRVFLQGTSTLRLSPLAHPILNAADSTRMAVASVGRGTVLTIANPWLSNQYVDGRSVIPASDNLAAAIDLAGWLLKQTQQ